MKWSTALVIIVVSTGFFASIAASEWARFKYQEQCP